LTPGRNLPTARTGRREAVFVRTGTAIALVLLLALIIGAATVQLLNAR
jgi:hypothetical protein